MLSGCGSNILVKTYRFSASYATLASVGTLGSPSSFGSKTRKPVIGMAVFQMASSSRPSMTGGWSASDALALARIEFVSFPASFSWPWVAWAGAPCVKAQMPSRVSAVFLALLSTLIVATHDISLSPCRGR